MSSSPPGGPSSAAATTGTPAGTATGNPAGSADVAGHPAVVRVRAALVAAGADGDGVVVLDDHARTAAAAAEQLGVTVGQIANSLVFAVPDDAAAGRGRARPPPPPRRRPGAPPPPPPPPPRPPRPPPPPP